MVDGLIKPGIPYLLFISGATTGFYLGVAFWFQRLWNAGLIIFKIYNYPGPEGSYYFHPEKASEKRHLANAGDANPFSQKAESLKVESLSYITQ